MKRNRLQDFHSLLIIPIAMLVAILAACDLASAESSLTGLRLDRTGLNLVQGEAAQLNASPLPENAAATGLVWTSTDASVVAVDQSGKLAAIGAGVATVTVASADGNKKAACAVAVWGRDAGLYRFSAADKAFFDWSFWLLPPGQAANRLDAAPVTVVLTKTGGAETRGYGLLFCYQDDDTYYKLLITTGGKIQVCKRLAGISYEIYPWAANSQLLTGPKPNTISVTRDAANLLVSVNGVQFPVPDASLVAGKVAWYASVGTAAEEGDLAVPVSISYRW